MKRDESRGIWPSAKNDASEDVAEGPLMVALCFLASEPDLENDLMNDDLGRPNVGLTITTGVAGSDPSSVNTVGGLGRVDLRFAAGVSV